MAAPREKRRFALDANILYDLAADLDAAQTLREVLQERGATLEVPPTVFQELAFAARRGTGEEAELALVALQRMQSWQIIPFSLVPVGHGIAEEFCQKIIRKGYLPAAEENDGLILAEAALAGIPVLISRDGHLLGIDAQILVSELQASDLSIVHVVHPRTILTSLKP